MKITEPGQMLEEREKIRDIFLEMFKKCSEYFNNDEWITKGVDIEASMMPLIKKMINPTNKSEEVSAKSIMMSFAYFTILVQGGVPESLAMEMAKHQSKVIALGILLGQLKS